ncbi:TraB/GumN family protein [Novosphingobium album (ex Liu et al. 2023)]|uniref:TraB/GumN family protein n=1 Tax=Novosphingobium album (ex Liu et al. 2023) TaxID=3031130 RepID=A0ABT5WKV9_9SPHN|nr:TraB/GumN family protein [Novosphingobium album (ex Liu et al. 2023)]MDE8650677.1 TraB/GumN family protein [Novosphingobium album (ex Liu et al. 2023)]
MHTISRFFVLLAAMLAAWIAPPAFALDPQPAATPAPEVASAPASAGEPARPALWKIADADTTIWLFGTVHVLPQGIDWFNGPVAAALDHSDELMTEIVAPAPADMQALVGQIAQLPQGQSLRAMLSPEEKSTYEAALSTMQVPVSLFDRYDIWYAAVGLSTLPLLQEGYATANGVEARLVAVAAAKGVKHAGLETPEYQIGLFDSLPPEAQRKYLNEVLAQLPTIRTDLKAMVAAWKAGNADELARLMNEGESDPQLMEILLINRNRAWGKWIARRLERPGTVFVAVGAGHLAGPGSVQEQLTTAGIEVRRVQ